MSTTSNVIGTIGTAFGKIVEMTNDRAKNKAGLFTGTNETLKTANVNDADIDLLKVYADDKIIDQIYEDKINLIMLNDASDEEKNRKLNELLNERMELRSKQTSQAENYSHNKRIDVSKIAGMFLIGTFGLAFAAKKIKLF